MVRRVKLPIGAHLYMCVDVEAGKEGKAWYKGQKVVVRALEPVKAGQGVIVVDDGNGVKPDYSGMVYRGVQTSGYAPLPGESIHYLAYIALSDPPGALPFTFGGIPAGEEVKLIDAATGNNYFLTEAGYDCIVKDMWIGFTQPTRWRMYSYYHEDYCCQAFFEAYCKPLNVYPFGYVKTSMVPFTEDWKMEGRVKNLGNETMYGKAWLTIIKKKGRYLWR